MKLTLTFTILGVWVLMLSSIDDVAQGLEMDVKCTIYQQDDNPEPDDVDVRILVIGLKNNSNYIAEVIPDHYLPENITVRTDSEGIFWGVAKFFDGDHILLFKVNLYEDKENDMHLVISGDDDAPCFPIMKNK